MERWIDLHTHSNISDGSLSPAALVRLAADSGLAAVALTDHDEVDGIAEAVAEGARCGVEVVPGVELSAQWEGECHILGYYPDTASPRLAAALRRVRQTRRQRMEQTSELLGRAGVPVSLEEARAFAEGAMLCRAHFAKAMVQKGYVGSVREAFARYLSPGRPGYSSIERISPAEAVQLIRQAGGCAFAAHLYQLGLEDEALFAFLKTLKEAGLNGVEGYYTEYTPDMQRRYQRMAARLDLRLSGGSDFHGAMKPTIALGTGHGDLRVPYRVLEQLKALHAARQR